MLMLAFGFRHKNFDIPLETPARVASKIEIDKSGEPTAKKVELSDAHLGAPKYTNRQTVTLVIIHPSFCFSDGFCYNQA